MEILGVATYQVLEEIADLVLSVEFSKDEIAEYELTATTIWLTYDLKGNFMVSSIADEGIAVELELTQEELNQALDYVEANGLKEELLKQIKSHTAPADSQ